MNDSTTRMNTAPVASRASVADDAGVIWAHSNPVELYRWIARRNDLLGTIAVAFRRGGSASASASVAIAGPTAPASPAIGTPRRRPAARRDPAAPRLGLI